MQTITMYLRAASVKGTLVDEWNQAVSSLPALTRGMRAELVLKLVDAKGRRVPMAQDDLQFDVEGDATIAAVSNGDINSEELNVTNHRRLYNGSALVILRSGRAPSKVVLKTSANKFKTLTTKLETK